MGDYSVIKRNEHLPLATTWVDLEIIMLSEMLDRKRQILSDITYMWNIVNITDVQFSSVAQSCPTLCDHMNCSTPGLPVYHHLPEFTQTHVHRVSDAIQLSHPLASPSPLAPNPSQHQSLFQWITLCMRWPKYWSFSFSIIPSKEHPGWSPLE